MFVFDIIHNKSKNTSWKLVGSWPEESIDKMLQNGDRVIVISLYSDTIKVPYYTELNGIVEWRWDDYPFDPKSL